VPSRARVVALINKVETLADRRPAHETAEQLLTKSTIESVVLASVRGDEPVLEVCTRRKRAIVSDARCPAHDDGIS